MPIYKAAIKIVSITAPGSADVDAQKGNIGVDDALLIERVEGGTRLAGSVDRVNRSVSHPLFGAWELPSKFDSVVPVDLFQQSGTVTLDTNAGSLTLVWAWEGERIRFEGVLTLLPLYAVIASAVSFRGTANKTDAVLAPPASVIGDLRGIGTDYNWFTTDYAGLWPRLVAGNCNVTGIEFFSWSTQYDLKKGLAPLRDPYKRLLEATRAHGGKVLVSLCNDNRGQEKYGGNGDSWSEFARLADEGLAFVLEQGAEGVLMQPVAEGTSSWAKRWEPEAIKRANAAGFETVSNPHSRPENPSFGAKRNAYHPFKTSDTGTSGDIVVTDTGTIISSLTVGGWGGTEYDVADVAAYAKRVREAGNRDLVIYGFLNVKSVSDAAIKAVGDAWR